MTVVTGSHLIAKTLKEHGVDTLFYLTGGPSFDIISGCQELGIRTVDFRHEQAAAFAAHAYTRVTGKPGVVTASSGPGTLNLLTGVYAASVDCAPMIILGGASAVHEHGKNTFQEVDQMGIMNPLCKFSHRPTQASRYPEIVSMAYRKAISGRPGPVYIDCGVDVLNEKVNVDSVPSYSRAMMISKPAAESSAIDKTIDILMNSSRPIVFAGGGAFFSGAATSLEKLVNTMGIPFYTSPMSRGMIPEDNPFSFPSARSTAMKEADVVLIVGSRLNWMINYGNRFNPSAKIIQIDLDDSELGHNQNLELGICGDAKTVVDQLVLAAEDRINIRGPLAITDWVKSLKVKEQERQEKNKNILNSNQIPIHPLRLCKEIAEFLDRDAILVVDGNEILHFARQSIPTYYPGHRLNSGVTGTMGVGLPYGLGAKIAKPDKQVLVLHGDGSMGMNAMEIDTAVRHDLPVVTVVSNNEGWFARDPHWKRPGRELGFTDFDEVAKALHGYGEKIMDPNEIKPALYRAFESGKPAVINVHVEPTAAGVSKAWSGSGSE
jgi:thiamine pyrophosphate-dependent acetolactate synthase large subunit-like protein